MLITSIQPQNETILISNKNEVYEVSFLQKLNKKKIIKLSMFESYRFKHNVYT